MFNAVNGLGGGGQVNPKASTDSNTAVYSTFSVIGFFAGSIANWLGIKRALSFGGIGYCIYVSSYLCYNHTQNYGFIVFAGFLLGCCAGILWAAQGAIMMAYPPEENKGRYISIFWMIFNMGGVIGSLVPLGQNIHTTTNSAVSDGTYVGFIVLTALGAILAFFLCDAKSVVRNDGSRVIVMKNPTWKSEFIGMWETLKDEPYVILLFPMFFSSNWFYTYHFNGVNLAQFNTRTRSLNSVLYWLAQIWGAMIFGYCLDLTRFRRTVRAKALWIVLFVLTFAIWGGGYAFQAKYTRAEVEAGDATPDDTSDDYQKLDWTDSGYIGPMFLYIFYVSFSTPTKYKHLIKPSLTFFSHTGLLRRRLAMLRLLVHGRHDQQQPQARQLLRLLQGHPVRRRRHHLAPGRPEDLLHQRVCVFVGASGRQLADRVARYAHDYQGHCASRGRPQAF
jgi:MFS family permease